MLSLWPLLVLALEAGAEPHCEEAPDVLLLQLSGEVSMGSTGSPDLGAGIVSPLDPDDHVKRAGADSPMDPDMNWFGWVKPQPRPELGPGPRSRFDGFRAMHFSKPANTTSQTAGKAQEPQEPTPEEQLRSAQVKSLFLLGVWFACTFACLLKQKLVPDAPSTGDIPKLSRTNLLFLAHLAAIAPASQDVYIPNMMSMAEDLKIDASHESLTLEVNWITCGISSVVIGIFSDRFGRKPMLIACFCCYITGSLMAAVSQSLWLAIVARILQGLGESAGMLPTAIFRDAIRKVEVRTQVNLAYSIVGTAAIICAPVAGGIIGSRFGWRFIFQALSCWGILLFMYALAALPETNPRLVNPLHDETYGGICGGREWQNFKDFATIFCGKRSPLALFIVATTFGTVIMSMLAAFPLVVETGRGMSTTNCSLAMLTFAMFVMVGACFGLFLKSWADFRSEDLITVGLSLFLLSGVGFLTFQIMTTDTILLPTSLILIPPCLLTFSGGIMNGAINSMYMEFFSDVAGTAAGFGISIQALTTSAYAYLTVTATEAGSEKQWMQCIGGAILFAGFAWMLLMSSGYEDRLPKKRKDSDTSEFDSSVFQRKASCAGN